jgi:hypothetical protein
LAQYELKRGGRGTSKGSITRSKECGCHDLELAVEARRDAEEDLGFGKRKNFLQDAGNSNRDGRRSPGKVRALPMILKRKMKRSSERGK